MKKNIFTTICTFAIAGGVIAGSTGLTTFALASNNTGASISAEKLIQPITTKQDINSSKPKVTISSLEDSAEMAARRTSADMDKEKATYIAADALEKKFNISLDDTYATPILCTRTDYNGLVYFVSFVKLDSIKASRQAVSKESEKNTDVYIAFINSKTGEVISAEKNPTATQDADVKG